MLKMIKLELTSLIKRPSFYISVLLIVVILSQETISLIPNRGEIPSVYVFIISVDLGLITLISPSICVIPYGAYFCQEIKNKYYFYISVRKTKNVYFMSRLFSGMLSAGITLASGFLIYEILLCIVFLPTNASTPLDLAGSMWEQSYIFGGGLYYFLIQTVIAFFFGLFCGVISMVTAIFTLDKYATIAIPFIFIYYIIYFAQRFNLNFLDISFGLAPTFTSIEGYFHVVLAISIISIIGFFAYKLAVERRTNNG